MNYNNRTEPTCKEYLEIKQEMLEQSKYLSELLKRYWNNPNNDWKIQRLKRPDKLYWHGKEERIRDDNDYRRSGLGHEVNNIVFVNDPEWAEIKNTERYIKNLEMKLKTIFVYEHMKQKIEVLPDDIRLVKRNSRIRFDYEGECDQGDYDEYDD